MNTPVSFEIAKVLKEKGFNIPQLYFYIDGDISWKVDNTRCRNQIEGEYAAPTIAEVVMWLYGKNGIWIWAEKYSSIFRPYAEENGDERFGKWEGYKYSTPTEAYEAAILFCLEKI